MLQTRFKEISYLIWVSNQMHVMPVPVVEFDTRGRPEHCLPGAEVEAHPHHAHLQLDDAVVRAASRQQQ